MASEQLLVDVDAAGVAVLPEVLRTALKINGGGQLSFRLAEDGTITVRVKHRRLSELAGSLTRPDQPVVSIEEMRR